MDTDAGVSRQVDIDTVLTMEKENKDGFVLELV